jgi:HKD family nuclease
VKFLKEDIGKLVLKELGEAKEARLAVAFFSPNDPMLDALTKLSKLTLIVSEEFTINNPYKLEELEKLNTARLHFIPPVADNGKLHAKVLIVTRQNGSHWILLGSANFTYQGMFSNQEACVVMESDNPADEKPVREIEDWFELLRKSANPNPPDLDQAKKIFNARSQLRLVRRSSNKAVQSPDYWALKTTSGGPSRKPHWNKFLEEHMIAVGWEEIPIDPSKVSDIELRDALKETYPDEIKTKNEVDAAANSIKKFMDLKEEDIVLICHGYNLTQKNVHIHGVARVIGPFRAEPRKNGDWRFKHNAIIQVIDGDFPRDTVASALGKKTLMRTIHSLGKTGFDRLAENLKEFGAHVEV